MIVTWLLDVVIDIAVTILSAIPAPQLPVQSLTAFFDWVGRSVRLMGEYFPVTVLLVCVSLVLAARLILLTWNIALFVFHQFWGSR